jgi:hypothetical protein
MRTTREILELLEDYVGFDKAEHLRSFNEADQHKVREKLPRLEGTWMISLITTENNAVTLGTW